MIDLVKAGYFTVERAVAVVETMHRNNPLHLTGEIIDYLLRKIGGSAQTIL